MAEDFLCGNTRFRSVVQFLGAPLRDFDPLVRGIGRIFFLQALDELVGQHCPGLCRQAEKFQGRYERPRKIFWAEFRERYESEKLSSLAESTQRTAATALNHLERVINPERLASVTTDTLALFQAKLRKEGMKETTIGVVLSHLRPALSWAVSMGMLPKVPDMHRPKSARGYKLMRGRPITTEEFERLLAAVAKVRPRNPSMWTEYGNGLWLSGLRLEESTILSWDDESPISIDLSGRHPRFRIYATLVIKQAKICPRPHARSSHRMRLMRGSCVMTFTRLTAV